jgi:hypothetical protein
MYRVLRTTATVVSVTALCLAVAVLAIAFIPGSPVTLALPTDLLTGWESVGRLAPGVTVDPAGEVVFTVTDPALLQRLLHAATVVPGLVLVAEIARRMAAVLRAGDPFTAWTARQLDLLARITAFGGVGVWAVDNVAEWTLSTTMLESGATVGFDQNLAGWLAVALIFAAFGQLVARGVALRSELDAVI